MSEKAGASMSADLKPFQPDDLCDFVAKDGTRCIEKAGCSTFPAYSLCFCNTHSAQAWSNGRLLNRSRDAKAARFKAAGLRLPKDDTRATQPTQREEALAARVAELEQKHANFKRAFDFDVLKYMEQSALPGALAEVERLKGELERVGRVSNKIITDADQRRLAAESERDEAREKLAECQRRYCKLEEDYGLVKDGYDDWVGECQKNDSLKAELTTAREALESLHFATNKLEDAQQAKLDKAEGSEEYLTQAQVEHESANWHAAELLGLATYEHTPGPSGEAQG